MDKKQKLRKRVVTFSLLFNAYWFLAIIWKNQYLPYLTVCLVFIFVLYPRTLLPSLLIALIGINVEVVFTYSGFFIFGDAVIPFWLCSMWVFFGAYLCVLKEWILSFRSFWLIGFGTAGGPISYLGGMRLDAVTFSMPIMVTLSILGCVWFFYSLFFLFILKNIPD